MYRAITIQSKDVVDLLLSLVPWQVGTFISKSSLR